MVCVALLHIRVQQLQDEVALCMWCPYLHHQQQCSCKVHSCARWICLCAWLALHAQRSAAIVHLASVLWLVMQRHMWLCCQQKG